MRINRNWNEQHAQHIYSPVQHIQREYSVKNTNENGHFSHLTVKDHICLDIQEQKHITFSSHMTLIN